MSSRSAMRAPTMGNSRLKSSPLRPAASKAGLKKPALALVPAATPAPPIAMERGSKVPTATAPASCATNSIIGRPNSKTQKNKKNHNQKNEHTDSTRPKKQRHDFCYRPAPKATFGINK